LSVELETPSTRSGLSRKNYGGFALLDKRSDSLYVEVICGKGWGRVLMNEIEELAAKWNLKYVTLSALTEPIPVYRKWGFVFGKTCSEDQDIFKTIDKSGLSDKLYRLLIKKGFTAEQNCKSKPKCDENGYTMTKCVRSKHSKKHSKKLSNS
jgi:GNAT superfamily N-acetyltransferase